MTVQKEKSKSQKGAILVFILAVFALFALILIIPVTREWFKAQSSAHPYLMGFAKFALLASAGELIAVRLASGKFKSPPYIIARLVIWGLIGVWITYMMKIFFIGSGAMMESGLLPNVKNEFFKKFLHALFTSATMNLTFGPTFMAVHKCSDAYLSLRAQNGSASLKEVITSVDWHAFVAFTLFKTVPLFWIPAHTVTFMLPSEYQVILAALLSVALGIILNLKRKS